MAKANEECCFFIPQAKAMWQLIVLPALIIYFFG